MTQVIETIRVATEEDAESLVNLIAAFRDYLNLQIPSKAEILNSLKRLLVGSDVEFLLACTDNNVPVAYAQIRYYYSLWSTGTEAQIEDLFVLPSERNRGLGSRLIQRVVSCVRDRGCTLITLNTNEQNTTALRLYTKIGFIAERARWQGGRQLWLEMPML